jgi:hypothetical protein
MAATDWAIDGTLLDVNDQPLDLSNATLTWTLIGPQGTPVLQNGDASITCISQIRGDFSDMYARACVMGSYVRTEMSAHKHGICSMTTVVRCPRTGHACSEPTCQERHWCRQMLERGLSHRGLPLNRKFRPRCCAKTRAGAPCIMRVVPGKRRCRFDGGLSKTKAGRARIAEVAATALEGISRCCEAFSKTPERTRARTCTEIEAIHARSEATRLVPQTRHTGPRSTASPHSTTSSALISIAAGIVSPSDSNVFLLITRRKRVGCSNGRSAGRAPFKIRSARSAARS